MTRESGSTFQLHFRRSDTREASGRCWSVELLGPPGQFEDFWTVPGYDNGSLADAVRIDEVTLSGFVERKERPRHWACRLPLSMLVEKGRNAPTAARIGRKPNVDLGG